MKFTSSQKIVGTLLLIVMIIFYALLGSNKLSVPAIVVMGNIVVFGVIYLIISIQVTMGKEKQKAIVETPYVATIATDATVANKSPNERKNRRVRR